MVVLQYKSLSRSAGRVGRKLAKELLHSVPAAENIKFGTTRGALDSAFFKPKFVEAVVIYGDGDGNWWGDVVLKTPNGYRQVGVPESKPRKSYDEALEHVKGLIGKIKGAKEHPLVQELQNAGIDPEALIVLRVKHPKLGCRWLLLVKEQIEVGSQYFDLLYHKIKSSEIDITESVPSALDLAEGVVLYKAEEFLIDENMNFWDHTAEDGGSRMFGGAAAFLMANGIINVPCDSNPLAQQDVGTTTAH